MFAKKNTPEKDNQFKNNKSPKKKVKEIFFCYDTEMIIVINFTNVKNGIFEVGMSHHDRPMGEIMYFVQEHYLEVENEWESPRTHCIDVATEKGIIVWPTCLHFFLQNTVS